MNEPYFNYDIAYDVYTKQIKKMAVGSIKRTGIKKIAKPVLLLAVIKGIEDGVFKQNRFEYEQLAEIYETVFKKYAEIAKQSEYTLPCYPFYHMQTSDFWNLSILTPHSETKTVSPSITWLKNNIEYAYLDHAFWDMLQQSEYRKRVAEFIVNTKIKTATANSRSLLRMFLGWLLAV